MGRRSKRAMVDAEFYGVAKEIADNVRKKRGIRFDVSDLTSKMTPILREMKKKL